MFAAGESDSRLCDRRIHQRLRGNQRAKAVVFGLEAGLIVGVVSAVSNACMPLVEWTAENMPAKRMGVVGVGLIVVGFVLQSVQYWVTVLDLRIG